MPVKLVGSALVPHAVVSGVTAAALGVAVRSPAAVAAGFAGAFLAADNLRRIGAVDGGFSRAFGPGWAQRVPDRLQPSGASWGWPARLPPVPEPRWTQDVEFAAVPGTDRRLLADLWQPAPEVRCSGTAIVYLHGSAWYLMDKDVLTRPLFGQLAGQGHVVMDVAYRLCPQTDVVGMVADAKRAVVWLKANAAALGARADRVVLLGASAGGHVALLAAYAPNHPELTPEDVQGRDASVAAVASFYGVPDLRAYGEHTTARLADRPTGPATARREPGRVRRWLDERMLGRPLTAAQSPPTPSHRQMMRDMVGGMPQEVPERYDLLSPISHVDPACPPTLLLHGEHDSTVPVTSVRHLHATLQACGVPSVYDEFPGAEHAFDLFYPPLAAPAARVALRDLLRFLACVPAEPSAQAAGSGDRADLARRAWGLHAAGPVQTPRQRAKRDQRESRARRRGRA